MSVAYTVALCTHNHAHRLQCTLVDLRALRQPAKPWELLFIDNGCTDGTVALLAGHEWPKGWRVRVAHEPKLGLSNARSRAIHEAAADYLIFIDDDETPDSGWLCAYERLIDAHAPDAFGSRIEVLFEGDRPAWLKDDLLGFLGQLRRSAEVVPLLEESTSFYGGNFGLRGAVCERIGWFDAMLGRKGADYPGGEEVDFYQRLLDAGFRLWWTPEAVIHHRIETERPNRRYFPDLHYRQGRTEGLRRRGSASRLPPAYLIPQLAAPSKPSCRSRRPRAATLPYAGR